MKLKFLLTTILASLYFFGSANTVSLDTAQEVALNFYKGTTNASGYSAPISVSLNYTQTENDGTVDFYVFDISPSPGFVMVSASDNVAPILAYSTESNFDRNFPDIGIKGWMQHTSTIVHKAIAEKTLADTKTSTQWANYIKGQSIPASRNVGIAPMLSTTWSQTPYYNVLCPYDNVNNGRSVTGCVATAMAQIMKFWSFPSQGVGSYSYVDSQGTNGYSYNIGRLSADFGATRYDWSNMPDRLGTGDAAISELMYHCGVAVGMNYSARGSVAYFNHSSRANALSAFKSYFSYDAQTIKYVAKASYTNDTWLSLIESELNQGRPVFYTGQDTGNIGGHGWVCDGYDASGMLHMNWGWGGTDNGYYNITNLDPAPYNFSWTQGAIIGIQPDAAVRALAVPDVTADFHFNVYPNPAKNKITIKGVNGNEPSNYVIYDVAGKKVSEGTFTSASSIIDLKEMSKGIYLLNLQNGQQVSTQKFVVGE